MEFINPELKLKEVIPLISLLCSICQSEKNQNRLAY